jgi:hypothetical protein
VKAKATEVMKSFQKRTYSIASNSGKLAWSDERVREGTILKLITFPLCNSLNTDFKASVCLFYSHSTYLQTNIRPTT